MNYYYYSDMNWMEFVVDVIMMMTMTIVVVVKLMMMNHMDLYYMGYYYNSWCS